jgi:pre-mRNA-splicing factor 38B
MSTASTCYQHNSDHNTDRTGFFDMSRAALWRQEGNAKERELLADDIFKKACEIGSRKTSALQLWGDDTSFHFNPLLLQNCIQSPYFQRCCENLIDWNAVIDEIYYEVKSLQVFQVGKQPSTAFCLLLRLLTLRMTSHQLDAMLKHPDSPYIRAIGFLYLRFVGLPDQMYGWIEPYLQDSEEFTVERAEQREAKVISMGAFVRLLFQSRDYYGQTTLPRLPITIERDLKVKLLASEKISERAAQHYKNSERMKQFQTVGCKVMALYGDDENPVMWYKAEVDRVITHEDDGPLKYPKFVVTFTEYGNTETVTLGELDVIHGTAKEYVPNGDGNRGTQNEGRDYRRDNRSSDLYEEVRRREREQVAGSGRGSWSRRPPTTKESLSSNLNVKETFRKSGTSGTRHEHEEFSYDNRQRDKTHHYQAKLSSNKDSQSAAMMEESMPVVPMEPPRKRNAADMAAIAERKRRLIAKYG